jgi:arylsulfatase A-like enzyme
MPHYPRFAGRFLLMVCCLIAITQVSSTASALDSRPNFLFILVDDQSPFDLKTYDPTSMLNTPNIDRLAASGMVFDGAYHMGSFSGAVCMPSRHMIMSGRTVWHLPPAPHGATGPGIKAGTRNEGNIYLLDVLATLCDLANVPLPASNEGISFRPVLEGKTQSMRDVMYGVYSGGSKPGIRSVKRGDWKLIQYEAPDRKVAETQLFNLAANPDELLKEHGVSDPMHTNLAADPDYAAKLSEMQALLLSEMRRLDDPFRFSNQPTVE